MKPIYLYQLILALFVSTSVFSAEDKATGPILISGTKFTYPLIEKWIAEYSKVNPTASIKLTRNAATSQAPDLNIIAHKPATEEIKENQEIIYAGRYALLPVTNSKNPLLAKITKKGLDKNEIDKLFFEVENYDEEPVKEKPKYQATIYARDNKASASAVLAEYSAMYLQKSEARKCWEMIFICFRQLRMIRSV